MPDAATLSNPEVLDAYRIHARQQRINTGKVASALVVLLMPAGVVLDYFVYPKQLGYFLAVRLLCSALAGGLWFLHTTSVGQRHVRWLGLPIALLPALAVAWMIYKTEDPDSPYYAGLNLVLLAVSAVVHWSILESFLAVSAVLMMYLTASIAQPGPIQQVGTFVNNLYFLVLTGIIVVTGNFVFNRLRLREFLLNYELEQNKRQLEASNQKLTELDQIKGRFFANISHELRTPLTLLLAPLENILARFGRSFDEETRQLLLTMQSNGMRLLKLINDLLDLVRLDSGVMQVRREPVAIEDFLRGLVSAARQMALDKRIKLEAIVEPGVGHVLVDRDKLEKIILNLQFNALKFTPAGGRVEIRGRVDDKELVLQVADTGMGISEKNLANVFGRFWQADDSSRRKFQGVGIGLSLVKELVEVQGGKVSIESKEGAGTTFTIRLPYLQPDPAAQPAETPEGAGLVPSPAPSAVAGSATRAPANVGDEEWLTSLYRRAEMFPSMTAVRESVRPVETAAQNSHLPKAVIADDEPDMLRFLKSQLESHYQIFEAVDGQQAIEKTAQFLPDIVLLDMMMPEKDGLQACRELRGRSTTQSIPIVLLTARADEETKLAALKAGASDFLPKPFSTTELHVRIKNLVESYHYQQKLAKQNRTLESTIEQLKETETQLVQTEKLASLGRLSAGIIHEINNPLNFATTGLYTLRNKAKHLAAEQQADYAEILRDVEDGLDRVKIIVSDLRSFTHPDMEALDDVPVAEIVTSALRFVSHEARDRIVIQTQLADGQLIRGNRNKLIQVLVNLLQNSFDALAAKAFANGERPTIAITGRVEGRRSILIVRDNGSGIDPQIIDKIFDPFFTTKDVGEGMGLGLSISYRIVQDCNGHIAVRSEHGRNCEFTLEFPIPTPEPAAQA